MYFWTYGLRNTWLDKCLKSPFSEDPSTSNMVNGPKNSWNLNHSTFTIFIDYCEGNSGRKNLSEPYAKSWNCLLTHWLLLTSNIFLTEAIYCNMFICNYLRNEKLFQNFFLHFLNLYSILKIFKKMMTLTAHVVLNLQTRKDVVS